MDDFCDGKGNQFTSDSSEALRVTSLAILVAGVVLIPACFLYYLHYRKQFLRLTHRNTFLMACFTLGSIVLVINYCVRSYVGAINYSCRAFRLLTIFQAVFVIYSLVVRLFSLLWRLDYNYKLIEETYTALKTGNLVLNTGSERFVRSPKAKQSTKNKSYYEEVFNEEAVKGNVTKLVNFNVDDSHHISCWTWLLLRLTRWKPSRDIPPTLHLSSLFASKFFANLLFIVIAVLAMSLSTILAFDEFPVGQDCTGCTRYGFSPVQIVYFIVYFGCGIFAIYALFRLRKVPDSLGIRKELFFLAVLFIVVNIAIILPLSIAFEDKEQDGEFDFNLLLVIQTIMIAFYMLPYQVYLAKRTRNDLVGSDNGLIEVLASEEGRKAFALYLVSNLALENLYFYEAVNKWKDMFNEQFDRERREAADEIYSRYIDDGAFMLINISYTCRTQIEESLKADQIEETFFDSALAEVFTLMSTDIYPRFKKTSYYKAFRNELEENA